MKRVTLFCGHYGSGKTNIAVNYALDLRAMGLEVTLADLDIVNPYFRSKDSTDELEKAGGWRPAQYVAVCDEQHEKE